MSYPSKTKKQYKREWYLKNRERILDLRKQYRVDNKAAVDEKNKRWKAENPDRVRATKTRWRTKNRERKREFDRNRAGLPKPTRPRPAACECCGGPPNGRGSFHLDHCHKTGKFRGWLCHMCNVSIGMLGDDLSGVLRAAEYLKRSDQ